MSLTGGMTISQYTYKYLEAATGLRVYVLRILRNLEVYIEKQHIHSLTFIRALGTTGPRETSKKNMSIIKVTELRITSLVLFLIGGKEG